METALIDLGFLGAIGLILWLAQVQEHWLDRETREDTASTPETSSRSHPAADDRDRRGRAA